MGSAQEILDQDDQVIRQGVSLFLPEEKHTDASGRDRILQTTKIPYFDVATGNHAVLGISVDITEEKRTQHALQQHTENLEHLVSERTIPDLERIRSSGLHLLSLINEVLDLSKVEAGKIEIHREQFEVRALIDDVVASVQPDLARRGNRLVVRVQPEMAPIRSDRLRLRQILINLVANAVTFTEQGTITVEVQTEPDADPGPQIMFRVSDTGVGIPRNKLEEVFQPFAQLDTTRNREIGGTGLGLAICRRICERLGGWIAADSRLGEGSVFTVRLPVEQPAPPAAPPPGVAGCTRA